LTENNVIPKRCYQDKKGSNESVKYIDSYTYRGTTKFKSMETNDLKQNVCSVLYGKNILFTG
jgi:hypothetical protein